MGVGSGNDLELKCQQGGETESTWRRHSADFAIICHLGEVLVIIMNETAMATQIFTYKYGDYPLSSPPQSPRPETYPAIFGPLFHHVAIYHTRLKSVSLHKWPQ